jgi:hypothetical protein
MTNLIFILLLISLLQTPILTRRHHHSSPLNVEEILDILKGNPTLTFKEKSFSKKEKTNVFAFDVDPDDRVNVELWNKLNAKDIKNMPKIDNYSSEATAAHWLKWYIRIAQRYSQVRFKK